MIKRGDIFYVDFGDVKGSEQGGIRPTLCIQNDTGNKFSPTLIVVPITGKDTKNKLPTHVTIHSDCKNGLQKQSTILGEQIRTISKERLREKIGELDKIHMKLVDKALRISIGLE